MVLGFMVTFVVAVCIAEAVKVNNDMNLGLKQKVKKRKKAQTKAGWM